MTDKEILERFLSITEALQAKEEADIQKLKAINARFASLKASSETICRVLKLLIDGVDKKDLEGVLDPLMDSFATLDEVNIIFKEMIAKSESQHEHIQASIEEMKRRLN